VGSAGRVDVRSIFVRRVAVALAALAVAVPAIAARADAFVYWSLNPSAGNGMIGRANLDGSSPNFTFLHGLFGAQGIAVDSNFIYWANGPFQIGRAPLSGGSPNGSFIVGARSPTVLAVDSVHGFIYWVDKADGTIGRAPLSGGSTGIDNSLIDTLGPATGVAVDSTHGFVYWTRNPSAGNGSIGRANLDGSSPNFTLLRGLFGAEGITLDSSFIYWANGPDEIGRANLDGSSPNGSFIIGARVGTPTGATAGTATGMAVDSNFVYWADQFDGSIGRAPVSGGSTGLNNFFIRTLGDPTGVAVDRLSSVSAGPHPPPAIAPLVADVQRLGLPHGIERSLLAKLDAAERAVDAADREAGCDSLNAYLHEVEAQSGHKLDAAPAAGLIADVTAIRQSLGCGAG
jgi:hypothetical protein